MFLPLLNAKCVILCNYSVFNLDFDDVCKMYTDIHKKYMYTFWDTKGSLVTYRVPESSCSVSRYGNAAIHHPCVKYHVLL